MKIEQDREAGLNKTRITLKDGRYMIFYTSDDQPAPSPEGAQSKRLEPMPKPPAEDKPLV